MTAAALQQLITLTPAIKTDWTDRLRGEPATTPLGRPHTLGCLMDATLTQLFAGLNFTQEEKWLRACPSVIASVHGQSGCGLAPLMRYFTAGEQALRAIVPEPHAGEMAHLLSRYRLLVQQEVESLCKDCSRRGAAGYCELSEKPLPNDPTRR